MFGADGADALGQRLHQRQRGIVVGSVLAGLVKAMAQQIVQVFDVQPTISYLIRRVDEAQGLGEGMIPVEGVQRIGMQGLKRIEAGELLERDQLLNGQLQRTG